MTDEKKELSQDPYEEDKVIDIDEMNDIEKSLGAKDEQVKKEKNKGKEKCQEKKMMIS